MTYDDMLERSMKKVHGQRRVIIDRTAYNPKSTVCPSCMRRVPFDKLEYDMDTEERICPYCGHHID